MTPLDLRPLFPAMIVAATGVAVLLVQAFTPRGQRAPVALLSAFGLSAALAAVVVLSKFPGPVLLERSLIADRYALFLEAALLGFAFVVVLLSPSYLRAHGLERGEYYALLLFSVVGMLGLVSAVELIALFVALEIMSVALYALVGLDRARAESQESAVKYFLTGAFSSAFFLYGVALLYGLSGSTVMSQIAAAAGSTPVASRGLALLGVSLILVGFAFKVASVPFHMWAPDVYEGAPTPVTALMAAGVKAAAFGGLVRVLDQALPGLVAAWRPAVAALAILTMIGGNLGALAQSNVKRMLAYSSVAHAGYLLAALVARPEVATQAILFYLVAYGAVNLGGFGLLGALSRDGREPLSLGDLGGLGERRPALAAALTLYLISLAGIPVSGGFVGKFYLFNAAVGAGYTSLAVLGVLMSVVSAYYYLRVVVALYMRPPDGEDRWAPVSPVSGLALALCAGVALVLGVYPAPLLALASLAARSLL